MSLEIHYILTFDKGRQSIGTVFLDDEIDSKKETVAYFKGMVAHQKRHLLKVSMYASCDAPVPSQILPRWFIESNGKLWSDDLGTVKYNKHWA